MFCRGRRSERRPGPAWEESDWVSGVRGDCRAHGGCLAPRPDQWSSVSAPSYLLMASALATVGAVAVVGLIALFGVRVPLVAVLGLLTVCSPAVLGRLLGRAAQAAHPDPPTVVSAYSTQLSPPSCHSLSDAELCWRWRTSAAALRHTVSADQRLYLIETRSALLDEFARRGPDGFARWVHTGTHCVNDPARFLTTPGGN